MVICQTSNTKLLLPTLLRNLPFLSNLSAAKLSSRLVYTHTQNTHAHAIQFLDLHFVSHHRRDSSGCSVALKGIIT